MIEHEQIWVNIIPSLDFTREWHTKEDNMVLCKYVSKIKNENVILQIGEYEGASSVTMLLSNSDAILSLIEPYVTNRFLTNVMATRVGNRMVICPCNPQDAGVPNIGQVGLLLIETAYSYEQVKADLGRWAGVKSKYIVVRNYSNEDVKRAVNEFTVKEGYEAEFVGDNIIALVKLSPEINGGK
jgi:hypothetical protein